jgi:hypothetical protein
MADIQLVDFPPQVANEAIERLRPLGLELVSNTSRFSGGTDDLVPDADAVVHAFYADIASGTALGLHAADAPAFTERQASTVTLVFVVSATREQLANLTGWYLPKVESSAYVRPDSVAVNPQAGIFALPLSRFQANLVTTAIFETPNTATSSFRMIARHTGRPPTGMVSFRTRSLDDTGRGLILYPGFGASTTSALVDVIREVLPAVAPDLLPLGKVGSWADDREFWVGAYADARKRLDEAEQDWEQRRAGLWAAVEEAADEQRMYLGLLTADSDELKRSVMAAMSLFGVGVEDADEKDLGGRGPEEDLWLWDGPVGDPTTDGFTLAEVKGTTRSHTEDQTGTLARYKARRMRALQNPNVRAMFIGNSQRNLPPAHRRPPFEAQMIEDATRDGDLLVSGEDLFTAVRAVLSGEIAPEVVRRSLFDQSGRYAVPSAAEPDPGERSTRRRPS